MSDFNYEIDSEIFKDHPDYCRGVVVFKWLNNKHKSPELSRLFREVENKLRDRVTGNPAEHPMIAAWRDAYKKFGARPADFRSSIEALTRRVVKPDQLPAINSLVDIGNLLSLRYVLPAGVHPISSRSKNIMLRKARLDDKFLVEIDKEPENVNDGEIVLADGSRVLTRRWTWRQAADTRTEVSTECVFFDIDGLSPVDQETVESAIKDLKDLVKEYCDGEYVGSAVLNVSSPKASFRLD
jgi:DNA/RNA-binding domain of Phe-tRNA-synthetase-like protein